MARQTTDRTDSAITYQPEAPVMTTDETIRVIDVFGRPELPAVCQAVDATAYPAFMQHTDLAPHWPSIYAAFPVTQFVMIDGRTGGHDAHGNMVPLAWECALTTLPPSAVVMVERALAMVDSGRPVTAYGALQVVVSPTAQRRGLSGRMLGEMAACAARLGAESLFAPIRPTQKDRYPQWPLASYASWTRADGLPLDPWHREHVRLGAAPAGVVDAWLTTSATLAHWEAWTGLRFPERGEYVVPGALVPMFADIEAGVGRYIEPHLWMHYRLR